MKKNLFLRKIYLLLHFIIIFAIIGCNPRVWCERNYPPIPNIERVRVDSLIFTPGATVYDTINLNSRDTLFHERLIIDSTGRAQLRIYKDAYGRLIANCEAKPDTITVTNERVTIREAAPVYREPPKVWYENIMPFVYIGGIIVILIKLFIK